MLSSAIRAAWCVWTSDPVDQTGWSEANPASGQCASTALVVQDHLGGELLLADVVNADGSRNGLHYWNRVGGAEVDLTREQFRSGEMVGTARPVERPADITRGRLSGNYHLLAARVARALAGEPVDRPLSVKGVWRRPDGRVLLCRNHRGEWELPGGRPERGELFADCLRREIRAQTGLDVAVKRLIGVRGHEAAGGRWVDLVLYECAGPDARLRSSPEHTAVAFLDPDEVELPAVYRVS